MIYLGKNHKTSILNSIKILYIEERSTQRERGKAKESLSTKLEEFMKESGLLIRDMAEDMSFLAMEILSKETISKEKLKEKELISGGTVRSMTESGPTLRNKDMAFGKAFTETATLVNGIIAKLKDTEFTLGLMETGTKESGKNV
jgi:hypothetical protein